MSSHHEPSVSKGAGWLAPHRDTFLTELGRLGYAARTIGYYKRAINEFCAQVESSWDWSSCFTCRGGGEALEGGEKGSRQAVPV